MTGRYLSLRPLIPWRQLERPLDLKRLFGREAAVTLEIGFGNGEYLARSALAHPERNFLGLEIHWGSVRRTLRRLHQEEIANVRVIQVDVQLAVRRLFAPASFQDWVALFPCPWPKRTHVKFRLFSRDFMRNLNPLLISGARGLVVTDDPPLRDYILAQKDTGWECRLEVVPARYNTKYERRWSGQGQQEFYELHFRKTQELPPYPAEEVELVTLYVPEIDVRTLELPAYRGEVTVQFATRVVDDAQKIAMVHTTVVEEDLTQIFWIQVFAGDERGWAITPAPGGGVLPTRGIQRALELVAEAARKVTR